MLSSVWFCSRKNRSWVVSVTSSCLGALCLSPCFLLRLSNPSFFWSFLLHVILFLLSKFWDSWQQLYWHTVLSAQYSWKEIYFEINKVWFYIYYLLIHRQRKFKILVNLQFQSCNTPKNTCNSRPVSLPKTFKAVVEHISGVLPSAGKIASYSLSTLYKMDISAFSDCEIN